MATAKQGRAFTRMNFRCSLALREAIQVAAVRSGVKLSEQTRVSLEKLYNVPSPNVWLPPVLQGETPKRKPRKRAKGPTTKNTGTVVA